MALPSGASVGSVPLRAAVGHLRQASTRVTHRPIARVGEWYHQGDVWSWLCSKYREPGASFATYSVFVIPRIPCGPLPALLRASLLTWRANMTSIHQKRQKQAGEKGLAENKVRTCVFPSWGSASNAHGGAGLPRVFERLTVDRGALAVRGAASVGPRATGPDRRARFQTRWMGGRDLFSRQKRTSTSGAGR